MGDYELYHSSNRKHKYIKKIGKRYFYTQQEIAAYLDGKKKDVTFEKGTEYDYDDYNSKTNKAPKMKDYHLDFNKQKGSYTYTDSNGKKHKQDYTMSDKIGVRVGNKKIQVYNTTNKKYYNDDERWSVKRRGRLKSEYAEDGSVHTLDLSNKKTFNKRQAKEKAREKELEDWQVSQGYRKTDAQLEKEKKARSAKRRKKAAKAASKHLNKAVSSLKKQSTRGKKAIDRWQKSREPRVEVIQSISEDKNYKRQNGWRG